MATEENAKRGKIQTEEQNAEAPTAVHMECQHFLIADSPSEDEALLNCPNSPENPQWTNGPVNDLIINQKSPAAPTLSLVTRHGEWTSRMPYPRTWATREVRRVPVAGSIHRSCRRRPVVQELSPSWLPLGLLGPSQPVEQEEEEAEELLEEEKVRRNLPGMPTSEF